MKNFPACEIIIALSAVEVNAFASVARLKFTGKALD